MAFSGGLNERMEELRFPNGRSPNDEYAYSGYASPPRGQNSFFSSFQPSSNDVRASLQRRFTTDSSKISGSAFGSQFPQLNSDYATARDLKNQQLEHIRAEKRKMEAQMKLLELQEEGLQGPGSSEDVSDMSRRLNRISLTAVSEPTTPPEYSENGVSRQYSRSNRYSLNNLASPPGLSSRFSQSSSHITSPPPGNFPTNNTFNQAQKPPAKSMPGSRRNSDEEEYFPEELPPHRSIASLNRYSMPVNSGQQPPRLSISSSMQSNGLGPLNTTSFLFDDNDDKHLPLNGTGDLTSPITKAYLQLGGDDKFPTLRSNGPSGILSANSAALDLANSRIPDLGSESWASGTKHRPSHQSMPQSELNLYRPVLGSPPSDLPTDSPARKPQRHSMGVTFSDSIKFEQGIAASSTSMSRPTSLQSSYSTNDLPTVKNSSILSSNATPPKTQAEQHLHNHNASMGRIPLGAVNNRQSRDLAARLSLTEPKNDETNQSSLSSQSALQASAAPFGPQLSSATQPSNLVSTTSSGSMAYNNSSQMYAYGMHSYNVNQMGAQMALNSQLQAFQTQSQGSFGQYGTYGQYGKDPMQRGGSGRRLHSGDEARFNNIPLDNYQGKLYELCKDQHGCRYLQRKLEENNAEQTQTIFLETRPHIVELMTDPFGNYLCQKLFEHCTEDQRTALINTAAPSLVPIALNQHGTRALQKMIEFVNAPEQVQTIINSLSERVVELVQDLNGNHVIQKCLNRLGAQNSEFIYDAVGKHCVIVGTHRHGCCVLQRCIDHSTGYQRAQLIARITENAFALVQDPFGNYVVQYILDLDEAQFTKPLCLSFSGSVPALSKQKFSSNVIEKCLRMADSETKRTMIEEMLLGNELEKMLRDSFANYVVQTAMDYADAETKLRVVDAVRPILPAIKHTPHGRRIAGKIMSMDGQGRLSGTSSGQITPNDNSLGSSFTPSRSGSLGSGRRQIQILGGGFFGGAANSTRLSGGYSGPGTLDTSFETRNYGMNSAGGNIDNTSAIFGPLSGSQNPYTSYVSNQPGPGYF